MIVYNLTDIPAPGKRKVQPQALRIWGRIIQPGKSAEIPDRYGTQAFAGHIQGNIVSVNSLPSWYQRKKEEQRAPKPNTPAEPVEKDEVVEKDE